jgi:hypothetical protein
MSFVTPEILAKAQDVANAVDHEDHDEAVRVALEAVTPLIAARALRDAADNIPQAFQPDKWLLIRATRLEAAP